MGMFDRATPKIDLATPEHIQRQQRLMGSAEEMADTVVAPWLKDATGYESESNQLKRIASETDLSNSKAVQNTYNTILAKNPQAANSWLKSVKPVIDQHIATQKASAGSPVKAKEAHLQAVRNRFIKAKGPEEGDKAFGAYLQSQGTQMQGTIPQGYRMSPEGNLEIIPGGPGEAKVAATIAQNKAKAEGAVRSSNLVNNTIKRLQKVIKVAKDNSVDNVFGVTGAVSEWVPSSERNNAETLVSTIKSHIGFDRLDRMRKESPTGGALGQVSEMELRQLNATLGSLEFSQTEEQFLVTLKQVQDEYDFILRKIAATGDGTYSPSTTVNTNPLGI